VGLSVVFFFLFSAGHLMKRKSGASPPAPERIAAVAPVRPPPAPREPVTTPDPIPSLPAGHPQQAYFTTAEALLAAVAEQAPRGKPESLANLTGEGPRTQFLAALLAEDGWRISSGDPWMEAGAMAGLSRYELKLENAASSTPAPAGAVTVDVERSKTEGWKVKTLRFDAAFVAQAAELLKPKGIAVNAPALTDPADPLDQARRFFSGVLSHDFKAARSLTDQVRVTHEKLAGMCIVFEEGEYKVAPKRPVVVTAGTADTAWAIVKIRSDKQDLDSEVGLEMEHTPDGKWIIHALDFNKMLESYVQATKSGNVFYSPIVKSAKGGESIVLYFEFDKAELHPRALHQLDIIASLLKSDPARKMRITGHSDALGTDDYNIHLSAVRAKNVRARLLELGVSATQIITVGVGSKAPLDPDRRADGSDNPEGRSRNRRTEIYLDF
jgi:outer membrane protein OmpA-like peptidoglycan-associated protein